MNKPSFYEAQEQKLRKAIEGPDKTQIYHYTSAEGFYNIIRNRQLFLTDAAFLNDSTEMANILDSYYKAVDALSESGHKAVDSDFLRHLGGLLSASDFDSMIFGLNGEDYIRHFVAAFSYQKDSLSMWNYYAKDQDGDGGYNIAFNRSRLTESFVHINQKDYELGFKLIGGRVIYDDGEKANIIISFLKSMAAVWVENEDINVRESVLDHIKSCIKWLSIFFKHECFAIEEEYRIVLSLPNSRLTDYFSDRPQGKERLYKIRFTNNMFTPYVKLKFQPEEIEGVCMSPLCEKYTTEYRLRTDFGCGEENIQSRLGRSSAGTVGAMRDVLQYGVHEFLRIHGCDLSDSQIERSAIPLRF